MPTSASASGKIILSGEYAVVMGGRGIAMPSRERMNVSFSRTEHIIIDWQDASLDERWKAYAENIAEQIASRGGMRGTYRIENSLPLGKGMGSSTALVIAMCRAARIDTSEETARTIEEQMNPQGSGLDFAVIWYECPLLFQRGETPSPISLPLSLEGIRLIDTGTPGETTTELVAWVKSRYESRTSFGKAQDKPFEIAQDRHFEIAQKESCSPASRIASINGSGYLPAADDQNNVHDAIATIGSCTERILKGEPIKNVIRDHHRAQVALGVVPQEVQDIIAKIERNGGSAKVLGAGGRTGGGGMVMVVDARA